MISDSLRVMWFVPPAVEMISAALRDASALSIEGRRNTSSDEQYYALCEERVDAVVTSIDNVLHWNQRTGPCDFCVVSQIETTTPLSLVVSADVMSTEQLRGKRILVDAPENGFVIALKSLLFEAAGLRDGDYELVPIGGVRERYEALLTSQGSATLLGPPFDALAAQQGLSTLATIQQAYPSFPGQGVVTRREFVDKTPALGRWLDSLQLAVNVAANRPELVKEIVERQGLPQAASHALCFTFPETLVPNRDGIELLIHQRSQLNLPGADSTYDGIVIRRS